MNLSTDYKSVYAQVSKEDAQSYLVSQDEDAKRKSRDESYRNSRLIRQLPVQEESAA